MKICDLVNAPAWLLHAETKDADVDVSLMGWVTWNSGNFLGGDFRGNFLGGDFRGGDFLGGNFRRGNFLGGNFRGGDFLGSDFLGGNFLGGNFRGGDFVGGNFLGGDFLGGNFRGGDFRGGKVCGVEAQNLRAYIGLYPYQISAFLSVDGTRYVQMGCLLHTIEKWGMIGIRQSNLSEFPDDGSEQSEERVAAFEFAKCTALRMKASADKAAGK